LGRLPVISGREAAAAFERVGFGFSHQKGSHMIYRRTVPRHTLLSIPDHKELKRGTLRALIRESGLTVEEFEALLK
jgi:predicted RNA binding protein YcfA (HicA-like mRNA interferase family)